MARDSFRTYRETSSAQARNAPSARSAAGSVRSAGAAASLGGRSAGGNSSAASRSANARSGNADAPRPSNTRAGNTAEPSRASTRGGTAERERSIETGREEGRPGAQEPSTRDVARERLPQVYQYAAGLAASPFSLMRRFADDMDRLLQDFGFNQSAFSSSLAGSRDLWQARAARGAWSPQIETFRRGDHLVVRADLPGLKREDVKIEVDNDVLTISGERSTEHEEKRDDYFSSERSYGRFYRAIPLPEGVKADDTQASFRDGVLEVSIPVPRERGAGRREVRIS